MKEQTVALVAQIVGFLAAVLTPVVVWLLNQRGDARQTRELDRLLKRTELLEKLRSLKGPAATDREEQDRTLDAEYRDILEDLALYAETGSSAATVVSAGGHSWWRRFWLAYPMKPGRPRIYRVIFRAFSVFAVLFGVLMLTTLPSDRKPPVESSGKSDSATVAAAASDTVTQSPGADDTVTLTQTAQDAAGNGPEASDTLTLTQAVPESVASGPGADDTRTQFKHTAGTAGYQVGFSSGQKWMLTLVNFGFYFGIGWLFRRAAIRQHERRVRKEQAGQS